MNSHALIRGSAQNPYHLSIGGVVLLHNTVAMIKKPNGAVILPSETIFLDESIESCFYRGMKAELGVTSVIERYLGTLSSEFLREEGTKVQKTTLFFLGFVDEMGDRSPTVDEETDQVMWIDLNTAMKYEGLEQGMGEFIKRALHYSV